VKMNTDCAYMMEWFAIGIAGTRCGGERDGAVLLDSTVITVLPFPS